MKNVGIITIIDNNNYGNRLQNYAVYKILSKMGVHAEVILNYDGDENTIKYRLKKKIKRFSPFKRHLKIYKFCKFNRNIKFTKCVIDVNDTNFDKIDSFFDAYIVGSDQVWNPYFRRLNKLDTLEFTNKIKISFAASFGVDNISDYLNENIINSFNSFDFLSVREESGKKIINSVLPKKKVEVLVDPTLLLTTNEWDCVMKKPRNIKNEKFIFCYFLGNVSEITKKEIQRIANENDCIIVDIFDTKKSWFASGPSEFLWLEKNAFLICTDSFHSSVFAFLYNRPFVIFEREDKYKNMSSRLDTLIKTFDLKNRKFNGKSITKSNLDHDYTEGYEILEKEREKSRKFLEKALEIKK